MFGHGRFSLPLRASSASAGSGSDTGTGTGTGTDAGAAAGERADVAGDPLLAVEDVSVSYGKIAALTDVNLRIDEGEVVSVIGPNGAGKSTLADAVSGFNPYEGSIRYRGAEVRDQRQTELVADGLIHCTETRDLFDYMSVADNLRLGSYRRSGSDDRLRAVYDLFPRLEERKEQDARTMSGGEQQMLAIGRALMSDPDLLVLDEPTLGLAPIILEDISEAIDEIREEGVTILLCEQNVTFAMDHADRISLLENGEIVTRGSPEDLRDDEYVREVYIGG